jgi:hypothetical protein
MMRVWFWIFATLLTWIALPTPETPADMLLSVPPWVVPALLGLAVVLTAISTGVSIDASVKGAKAESDSLKAQAATKRAQGYAEEERIRDLNRRRLRKMREAIGTSGVRADVGTPLDTYLNEVGGAEIDAMNARIGANYAATQAEAAAANSLSAGKIAALGTGLDGTAQITSLGLQGARALQSPTPTTTEAVG